jgi:putative ABC transport system ATP-binding protein
LTDGPRAETNGDIVIQLKHVCRRVTSPDRWLLREVTFELLKGQRVVIAGPSGSGKSVLLRAIALLDGIDSGEVLWRDAPITGSAVPQYRSNVIYLHQHPALLDGTVRFNLELPFQLKQNLHRQPDPTRISQGLAALQRDEQFLDQSVRNLSGGERQVVAILRALQLDPQVLLLDEPTAAADAEMTEAIERLILQWADQHKDRAFIWVTHNEAQAERVAELRMRMNQGQLSEV